MPAPWFTVRFWAGLAGLVASVAALVLTLGGCGTKPGCHRVQHAGKTVCQVERNGQVSYVPIILYVPHAPPPAEEPAAPADDG